MRRPLIKNYIPLIHGIIDALLFLECSGDDDVNPDSAVKCMENISYSLHALSPSDQLELRAEFIKIADGTDDEKFARFVRAIPHMIGIANSD